MLLVVGHHNHWGTSIRNSNYQQEFTKYIVTLKYNYVFIITYLYHTYLLLQQEFIKYIIIILKYNYVIYRFVPVVALDWYEDLIHWIHMECSNQVHQTCVSLVLVRGRSTNQTTTFSKAWAEELWYTHITAKWICKLTLLQPSKKDWSEMGSLR